MPPQGTGLAKIDSIIYIYFQLRAYASECILRALTRSRISHPKSSRRKRSQCLQMRAIHFRKDEFLRLQQRERYTNARTSDLGDFDTWIMRLVRAHSIVVGSQTRPANT
jgi:hypothetical protein